MFHCSFYTALALQELVNETPINVVAHKFKCQRGMLQSLQQMASTFAGIVSAFCNSLQWSTLALVVSQFKDRLYFGIHRDLIDLMRLPDLSHKRARALHDAGITSLVELASANVLALEQVLFDSLSFDSAKRHENEDELQAAQRNTARNFYITGKAGMTVAEAAKLLIEQARQFVQHEIGVGSIQWTQSAKAVEQLHMSLEEAPAMSVEPSSQRKRKTPDSAERPSKLAKLDEQVPQSIKQIISKSGQKSGNAKDVESVVRETSPAFVAGKASNIKNVVGAAKDLRRVETVDQELTPTVPGKANNVKAETKVEKHRAAVVPDVKPSSAAVATPPKPLLERNHRSSINIKDDEKPSTSAASRKELLQKEIEERRRVAMMKINKKRAEMENMSKGLVGDAPPRTTSGQTPPATRQRESGKENLPNKDFKTPTRLTETKCNSGKETLAKQLPRRSPRNHQGTQANKQAEAVELNQNQEQELFASDDSFMLNTGLTAALTAAESKAQADADEIPSSQPKAGTPGRCRTLVSSQLLRSQRRRTPKPGAARGAQLREQSTTSSASSREAQLKEQAKASSLREANYVQESNSASASDHQSTSAAASSSIELSNLSLENSLIKNPLQLNASHILSCSKTEENASSFSSIDIVDICGNRQLFRMALQELLQSKRCGFSIGLQPQTGKRKPLIGGNLLINQMAAAAEREAAAGTTIQFQVDDSSYLAGIAFCLNDNVVYYMNMQPEEEQQQQQVGSELKVQQLSSLLSRQDLTLLSHDAKEQLKVLRQAVPQLNDIQVLLEDPKVANWLLQPDKTLSFHNMVTT